MTDTIDTRTVPHTTLDVVKALDAAGVRATLLSSFGDGASFAFDHDALDRLRAVLDPYGDFRQTCDHEDMVHVDDIPDYAHTIKEAVDTIERVVAELPGSADEKRIVEPLTDLIDELRKATK